MRSRRSQSPRSASPAGSAGGAHRAREIAYAILLCLAGAGLALYAATRTWTVDVTPRPAPLPDLRTPRDGGPWLSAIAVVGLAGAGALVATTGAARRAVGVLLILVGAGLAAGGAYQINSTAWPALCAAGGVAVAVAGVLAVARGRNWPGMGARYARRTPSDRPVPAAKDEPVASSQAWDALDRGEDPTVR